MNERNMNNMMNDETNEGKQNPFTQTKNMQPNLAASAKPMPTEVMDRLSKHAERTGEQIGNVIDFYKNYIKENYDCDNWSDEDDDLLVDWAEQCFIVLRKGTTGGSNNTTYVGQFIGVDAKKANRGTGLQSWLVREYRSDANQAMAKGAGHYVAVNGLWTINTAEHGVISTAQPSSETPEMGIHVGGGDYICFVSRQGKPYTTDVDGRYAYFLGNEQEAFVDDGEIKIWRVDLKGDDSERSIKVGHPCVINARPPKENATEYRQDILDTYEGFMDTINYTDEFVDESVRPLLMPSKLWTSKDMHEYSVSIEDLTDAYHDGLRTFQTGDGQGRIGPLVFTRGTVNRLSTEARETEYDQNNRQYSMSLSSSGLQSMYGQGAGSEVMCNIGSAVHDLTHPFNYTGVNGEMFEYAERSTVYVFGRIGMMMRDNTEIPKLTVFGIYVDPRRARPRATGGNSSTAQFE